MSETVQAWVLFALIVSASLGFLGGYHYSRRKEKLTLREMSRHLEVELTHLIERLGLAASLKVQWAMRGVINVVDVQNGMPRFEAVILPRRNKDKVGFILLTPYDANGWVQNIQTHGMHETGLDTLLRQAEAILKTGKH